MTDLLDFVRARLDEDEQAAREAGGAPWEASIPNMIHVNASAQRENRAFRRQGYVASAESGEHQRHIARHDPARVLREVEAKRRIVDLHGADPHECVAWDEALGTTYTCYEVDCPTLRLLALPYADHPDYQQEWRPA